MKKFTFLAVACLMFIFSANAQQVGDKVQIEWSGSWYDGEILKVDGDEYYITYDGWDDSWDEWVTIDRLKGYGKQSSAPAQKDSGTKLTKFKVGDKVEVEYGMIPEPATVIEVGENKYHIEFHDKLKGDKWVKEHEITKL